MKVLSIASEIFPLVKTGGLADVTGALPLAMAPLGIEMGSFVPGYPAVLDKLRKKKSVHSYTALQGGPAAIVAGTASGLNLLVLDAPHLFNRPGGPYGDTSGADWPDNWRRFAAFCLAAGDIAAGAVDGYRPDVVHAHDWQAAMALAYMRHGATPDTPKVITVHNLAFQGQYGASIFGELGLPPEAMSVDGVEYYGGVGYLKAGLQAAWAITTVSPTYAQEIRTPEFGMGLDGLVNLRAADLVGIVNGIDTDIWDPATDEHLVTTYTARTLKARTANKRAIEDRFSLAQDDGPIFCVVSRLTWQKGMDILASQIDAIAGMGARLAVLGSGDRALEGALLAGAARHRGRIGVVIGYDESLSHLLQGGADAILIPSRFEPCGLTQLYGLRYGCVPVVARTGGLADTVIDANEAALSAGVATGFQHAASNGDAFVHGVRRAVEAFANKPAWAALQKQGMKADVSWGKSAARYADLYRTLLAGKTA
ncbi:MAG TPA: glycogen synthase GlgA [Rhizobiaceae bacterium]|nr:glycogen synthase GlgA [Rhizobiaceae bacterium]